MNKTLSLSLWITSVLLAAVGAPAAGRFEFELIAPVESDTLEFHDELVQARFVFVEESVQYDGRILFTQHKSIGFTLVNLCPEAIAIDWDMCSITLSSGEAGNVVQEGVRFLAAGELKPPTTIPSGNRLTTSVMPIASIDYSSSGGWTVGDMELYDGASIGFYLSLIVRGESRGYDFRFRVWKPPNLCPVARISVIGGAESGEGVVRVRAPIVTFDGSHSTAVDGYICSQVWDFGDGTTASGDLILSHTYADLGPYDVKLVVTDNERGTGFATQTVCLFRVTQPPAIQPSVEVTTPPATQPSVEAASPPVTQPGTEVVPPPNATSALATAAMWVRFFILLGFATGVLGFLLGEW